ncbi:hypothetical protein Tco_1074574, partial [Tanacetum coccineum]
MLRVWSRKSHTADSRVWSSLVFIHEYLRWSTCFSTSSPSSLVICNISVSSPLLVLSDPAPVSASAGDRESRMILADVSSSGYVEGPVDASSVVGIHFWSMNWSVVLLLFGICRASRDWTACSSVTMALLLPSTVTFRIF